LTDDLARFENWSQQEYLSMFGSQSVTRMPVALKCLLPAGFAVAMTAGLLSAPAHAGSLADYYRTMYTMKFCQIVAEGDEEASISVAVEQEVTDQEATSEDIAPIFDQLNAEYNADPVAFCESNTQEAQQVLEQVD
jgi:hypothetical protein